MATTIQRKYREDISQLLVHRRSRGLTYVCLQHCFGSASFARVSSALREFIGPMHRDADLPDAVTLSCTVEDKELNVQVQVPHFGRLAHFELAYLFIRGDRVPYSINYFDGECRTVQQLARELPLVRVPAHLSHYERELKL